MRIVKLDRKKPYIKTIPARDLSVLLLDLRNMCNKIEYYICENFTSIDIYEYLEKTNKTYLFQTSNFDKQLYEQCKSIIKYSSMKPSYLLCDFTNIIEIEQYKVLRKFEIPIEIENEIEYIKAQDLIEDEKSIQLFLGENDENKEKKNFD